MPTMKDQRKKVSTACQACRRRKSRCDGLQPQCRTCQTHGTNCIYNFDQDSRKTPSKAFISALKNRITTLEGLLDEILDAKSPQRLEEILQQVREQRGRSDEADTSDEVLLLTKKEEVDVFQWEVVDDDLLEGSPGSNAIKDMTTLIAHLHVDEKGAIYSVGATSNVINHKEPSTPSPASSPETSPHSPCVSSSSNIWLGMNAGSGVTLTPMEHHLVRLYFTWQHPIFYLFSPERFMRDMANGGGSCYSPLLLGVVLATGCHFSDLVSDEQSDYYFAQAKSLLEHEMESPTLTTCQALAMMGMREAGRGRDRGSGWLYSGMAFRMALDLGIQENPKQLYDLGYLTSDDVEERALTFWGAFVSDKGWTAYLGRPESLPYQHVRNYIHLPVQTMALDGATWTPYTDSDFGSSDSEMTSFASSYNLSRFKYICQLVEHLAGIVRTIYNKGPYKGDAARHCVTDLHTKLCAWYNSLPHHMRMSPQAPPAVLIAHIFYHTALILLFRPFVQTWKARPDSSADLSPLALCTQSALAISRYIEQYRRTYSLRRYTNWLSHAVFTAATIYVINGAASSSSVTESPSGPQSEAAAVNKEAVRKLRELMGSLEDMSRAWRNAENCLNQIRQWIQKYQLAVGPNQTGRTTHFAGGTASNSPSAQAVSGEMSPSGNTLHDGAWMKMASPTLQYPSRQERAAVYDGVHSGTIDDLHPTLSSSNGAAQLISDLSMFDVDIGLWNDMINDFGQVDAAV